MGYAAITTSDPEEALSLVWTGRSRLVLADVNMPGMNGYELLDRALRCDSGIHVIVMTGEYTLESALDAIRRGATDFLPKPIDRVRLKKTLDEVATIYDQRKRVRAFEEQLLKDLAFHGIVEKARSCWKYSISRGRWRGITRMCCWWDQPGRGKSWWPGRSTTSVR
jgi:DNA-binding NtrC family response regulator